MHDAYNRSGIGGDRGQSEGDRGQSENLGLFSWREGLGRSKRFGMPRKPRVEYAGGLYHVMSHGDRGTAIVRNDDERAARLCLEKALERMGMTADEMRLLKKRDKRKQALGGGFAGRRVWMLGGSAQPCGWVIGRRCPRPCDR